LKHLLLNVFAEAVMGRPPVALPCVSASVASNLNQLVSGQAGDGFLLGDAYGLKCYRNAINNHGAKGIFLESAPSPGSNSYVYNNLIENEKLPSSGFGVVTWIPGTQVYSNTVTNTFYGLQAYGYSGLISNVSFCLSAKCL
jgi:hypothetical protein